MIFVVFGIGGEGWSGGPCVGLWRWREGQGVEERGRGGMGVYSFIHKMGSPHQHAKGTSRGTFSIS